MFHFPRLPPSDLCVRSAVTAYYRRRVAPFGNPRISLFDGSPRLIAVTPRPSSARSAKASTVRLFRLICATCCACAEPHAYLPTRSVSAPPPLRAAARRVARERHLPRLPASLQGALWTLLTTCPLSRRSPQPAPQSVRTAAVALWGARSELTPLTASSSTAPIHAPSTPPIPSPPRHPCAPSSPSSIPPSRPPTLVGSTPFVSVIPAHVFRHTRAPPRVSRRPTSTASSLRHSRPRAGISLAQPPRHRHKIPARGRE